MDNKTTVTISKRQQSEKSLLLEQLRKIPVVQIACEKSGVGRATYYRWRQEDQEFAKNADEALQEGSLFINDLAESQLLTLIKDGNLGAIALWLKTHHAVYTSKLEIMAKIKNESEALTPEQEVLVTKALKLAALIPDNNSDDAKEEDI